MEETAMTSMITRRLRALGLLATLLPALSFALGPLPAGAVTAQHHGRGLDIAAVDGEIVASAGSSFAADEKPSATKYSDIELKRGR
jgi:hypothetical protein